MQGVFVHYDRPKTKKELKAAVLDSPESVAIEATSIFGNEYDGPLTTAPNGMYTVVGPSPHERKWYATIHKSPTGVKVT